MQIRHFCALALSAATLTLFGCAGFPGEVSEAPPGLGAKVPPVASVELANTNRITILRTYPDLAGTVEFLDWTRPCNQFSIYVSVENRGPVPAGAFTLTGTMTLLHQLGPGSYLPYYGDNFSISFGPLPAMTSDGQIRTFSIPQDVLDGRRVGTGPDIDFGRLSLTVNVDPTSPAMLTGAVSESDESNNTNTFTNGLTCREP